MSAPADLVLFTHLVQKPDSELDLERAALLIAEAEYPELDVAGCVAKLDTLGQTARQRLKTRNVDPARVAPADAIAPLLELMYVELGFRGNVADYYDPRNSFLNDVLERRTGIPITLAIVLIAICRRVGIEARGVSFPGHFLVRVLRRDGSPAFVDPFDGRLLEVAQMQVLYDQAVGEPGDIDERYLEPASRAQILARMLNNLRAIYEVRGDRPRLRRVLERLAVISPSEEVRSRLDLLVQNGAAIAPRVSIN